jgi:hypothetical protein
MFIGRLLGSRVKPTPPPGPPMTLGSMRELGVQHLIAFCLHDAWRHQALIDVSSYQPETPVPWCRTKVKCSKCGRAGPLGVC